MASSVIKVCADCGEPFCESCDVDCSQCSECKQPLCEGCAPIALDERKNRCYECDDPELSSVQWPEKKNWKHTPMGHIGSRSIRD